MQWECCGDISESVYAKQYNVKYEYLVYVQGVGHGFQCLGAKLKILIELEWQAEVNLDVELGTPNSSAQYRCHREI